MFNTHFDVYTPKAQKKMNIWYCICERHVLKKATFKVCSETNKKRKQQREEFTASRFSSFTHMWNLFTAFAYIDWVGWKLAQVCDL